MPKKSQKKVLDTNMCCDHYSIKIAKVCYRTRKGSKQNITGKTSTNLQLNALVQASQLPIP